MRWDEIIDPRLRAYRRSTLRAGGPVRSGGSVPFLTFDEVREMRGMTASGTASGTFEVTEENRKAIAVAFGAPEEILGS